ncbi:MAG: ABC transporter permease, partial [Hyphomicrobiaceae bacterium]
MSRAEPTERAAEVPAGSHRAPAVETPIHRFLAEFAENPIAVGALGLFMLIVALAVAAPWIAPQNPYDLAQVDILDARLVPGTPSSTGTFTHWLGTDGAGRDLVSGILYGLRISLFVGVASGLIAMALGSAIGLVATYAGGRIETLVMRLVDLQLSFP